MPQSPLAAYVAQGPGGGLVPLKTAPSGALLTAAETSEPITATPVLNITVATLIKATPGTIGSVSVVVAGSAAGAVHDCATVAAASTANTVAPIPTTGTTIPLDWPCENGIVVSPGTGQTLAVKFV